MNHDVGTAFREVIVEHCRRVISLKRSWILNAIIAVFALITLVVYINNTMVALGDTKFDDAYMFTRYAKHWLAGQGFSWNAVDGPAYGITSTLYLFLITIMVAVTDWTDAMVLTTTSWFAGVLAVMVLVILGFLVQIDSSRRKSLAPLLVVPAMLFMSPFYQNSITGMETTLSLLANSILVCAMVLAARKRNAAMLIACVLAGILSYETRPDNGLYALLLPPLFFIAVDKTNVRFAMQYFALITVLIAGSLVMNRFLFGEYLPLPFYAKAAGFYQGYIGAGQWNAMAAMLTFLLASLPFLLVIVATASRKVLPQLAVVGAVVFMTFAYFATVTQIMGWSARYYYPSIAFVILAAYIAAFSKQEDRTIPGNIGVIGNASYGSIIGRLLFGLSIAILALPGSVQGFAINAWSEKVIGTPVADRPTTQYRVFADRQLPKLGWWAANDKMSELLNHLPKNTVIAASEYGFLASRFPDLTIIDLIGLHDRVIARNGFSAEYVLSRRPDLIWFPHEDYTHIVAQLMDNITFQQEYEFYPGAYNYGIAIRKTSDQYTKIKDVIGKDFLKTYPWYDMANYEAVPIKQSLR